MDTITISVADLGKVSDGYHTIEELYDHRITLYIALCKQITNQPYNDLKYEIWRSKTHSDGKPAGDGWFIMGIGKLLGEQITYHLPLSRWDETNFAETLGKAPEWDEHSSAEVLERLKTL